MSFSVCTSSNYRVCPRSAVSAKSLRFATCSQRSCTRAAHTQPSAHLHDIEKHLLAQTVLLLEELVLGIRAGNVSANQLLARRRHLQQLRVLVLDGHVLRIAQQLPHDGPEVVRNPFPDEILSEKEKNRTL